MSVTDDNEQFFMMIKNYGEIPSSNVKIRFKVKNKELTKEDLNSEMDDFDLGPLLPNMEKRYWFFIESEMMEKARDGKLEIFTLIYIQYAQLDGNSGYGLISKFDSTTNSFVHKNMWID